MFDIFIWATFIIEDILE